jgi:hypothetical protein
MEPEIQFNQPYLDFLLANCCEANHMHHSPYR